MKDSMMTLFEDVDKFALDSFTPDGIKKDLHVFSVAKIER